MYGPNWGQEIYPRQLEVDPTCGECGERPHAWGDWLCRQCRESLEAELRRDRGEDLEQDSE